MNTKICKKLGLLLCVASLSAACGNPSRHVQQETVAAPSCDTAAAATAVKDTRWLAEHMMADYPGDTTDMALYWSWMQAANRYIEEYDRYRGRNMIPREAREQALHELREQYEAAASAVLRMGDRALCAVNNSHYELVNMYGILVDSVQDARIKELIYQDFYAWHKIYLSQKRIAGQHQLVEGVRQSDAYYLMFLVYSGWCKQRYKELLVEERILLQGAPFASDSSWVTMAELNAMRSFVETPDVGDEVIYLECAMAEWIAIRKEIASLLPPEQKESYWQLTKQSFRQLYIESQRLLNGVYA